MKYLFGVCLLCLACLGLSACGLLSVEASFKTPLELTATALDRSRTAPAVSLGKLAFMQGGDIWLKDLPGGKPRQLTNVGQDSQPRWSPSGQWLAFREDSHLWLERATGTDAHVVQGGAAIDRYVWSPVEDRLAYAAQGSLSVETADGGRLWHLVQAQGAGHGVRNCAWSADGHWIAFDRVDRHQQGLWRIPEEGTAAQTVYRNANPVQLAGWSPDGQTLLFWQAKQWSASMLADGAALMLVGVNGGKTHSVGHTLLHSDFLSWAPDGKRLALIDGGNRITWQNKTLAVATVQGSLHRLSPGHSSPTKNAYLYPAWSPDGHWIAVTRGPGTRQTAGGDVAGVAVERRHIWLVDASGSSAHQLTSSVNVRDERPQWSTDGSTILFARLNGKFAQLWMMQSDGSHQRQVADDLSPGPSLGFWGYYGYVDWGTMYDWWPGRFGQVTR